MVFHSRFETTKWRLPGSWSPDYLSQHGPVPFEGEPRIIPYGPSDVQHEGLEVMDVVHAHEDRPKHLSGKKKMPQIGPAVAHGGFSIDPSPRAGQTRAPWLDDGFIFSELSILEIDPPRTGKGRCTASVSCGQHAVEHVHSGADGLHDIPLIADTHEVPRTVSRKLRRSLGDDVVNQCRRLTDCDPPDGIPGQVTCRHFCQGSFTQGLVGASLNNPEQGLLITSRMRFDAPMQPRGCAIHRHGQPSRMRIGMSVIVTAVCDAGGTIIKGHDDVCTEIVLDFDGSLGSQLNPRTIDDRLKDDTLIIN